MVLDEDKRLAKRRLIEANRARKRAESEGGIHVPIGGNGKTVGPSPPKQSPSATAAGYSIGTPTPSMGTAVKLSPPTDMTSFSHPHPPNLTVYSQTNPGAMGITVNYTANGSNMTLPITQVPVGLGPSVVSSTPSIILPCPVMSYGRHPVTAPPYEPNVPHLVQHQPSGHLVPTDSYNVAQLGQFVNTKAITTSTAITTDELTIAHCPSYSGTIENSGFWHPSPRTNGNSSLVNATTTISGNSSQRANMYRSADVKVEWSGEYNPVTMHTFTSLDSLSSGRQLLRGRNTPPCLGVSTIQPLRSLGSMTCETANSTPSSSGSVEHQILDGLPLNINNGPTLPLISTMGMDSQPGSTNTSESMVHSTINSPPSGFTLLASETPLSFNGCTATNVHSNEANNLDDMDSHPDFPWTQEDQDLVDTIRKAYDTIHFANSDPNVSVSRVSHLNFIHRCILSPDFC